MHTREWNKVFQSLQLADNQSPMRPRARVRDIEMISSLLSRKLGTGLARDPVPKLRDLPLEFARLVFGIDPVEDIFLVVLIENISFASIRTTLASLQPWQQSFV